MHVTAHSIIRMTIIRTRHCNCSFRQVQSSRVVATLTVVSLIAAAMTLISLLKVGSVYLPENVGETPYLCEATVRFMTLLVRGAVFAPFLVKQGHKSGT